MKNLITIGMPSKGRLKDKAISYLKDNGLKNTLCERAKLFCNS